MNRKRFLAWLIALTMVVGMLPMSAFAANSDTTDAYGSIATISEDSLFDGTEGDFAILEDDESENEEVLQPEEAVPALEEEDFEIVEADADGDEPAEAKEIKIFAIADQETNKLGDVFEELTVKSTDAKDAGITKEAAYESEVTVIDAMAAICAEIYDDFEDTPSKYLTVSGTLVRLFEEQSTEIMFYVNHSFPKSGSQGSTALDTVLKDGDKLVIFPNLYDDMYMTRYLAFDNETVEAEVGKEFNLSISGEYPMMGEAEIEELADYTISVYKKGESGTAAASAVTDDNGTAAITLNEAGDYYATVTSAPEDEYGMEIDAFAAPYAKIIVSGTEEPTEDLIVNLTVSKEGTLALVNEEISVRDLNGDGIFTYDEALEAAHAAYCPGGYAVQVGEYTSVTKLWGVETYNTLFYRNGEMLQTDVKNTEGAALSENDKLVASVNKDNTLYSDKYSYFNVTEETFWTNANYRLQLRANTSLGASLVPDAQIGYWKDGTFTPVEGLKTDSSGVVNFIFDEPGTYVISAEGTIRDTVQDYSSGTPTDVETDCPLIAPYCVLTILPAPVFDTVEFWNSQEDAEAGKDPLVMTPEYTPGKWDGYTLSVPDYQSSFYTKVTMKPEEEEKITPSTWGGWLRTLAFSNSWGGGSGSELKDGVCIGNPSISNKGTLFIWINDYEDGGTGARVEFAVTPEPYATLKELTVDGIIAESFDRETRTYHILADSTKDGIAITATGLMNTYVITMNGVEAANGAETTVLYDWDADGKMSLPIVVSGNGVKATTYTLELEKMTMEDDPTINLQPEGAEYITGDTARALKVQASANGELTYQWYKNAENSEEGAAAIEGATAAEYTPSTEEIEDAFYFCEVTNTNETGSYKRNSDIVAVTVYPDPTPVVYYKSIGEELDPEKYPVPMGYTYNVGDTDIIPLEVVATSAAEGGTWTYQWCYTSSATGLGGSRVGNEAVCTPSAEKLLYENGAYYNCSVTYTFNGKQYRVWPAAREEDGKVLQYGVYVYLQGTEDDVQAPMMYTQPTSASYTEGDTMSNLNVYAYVNPGNISYQWYVNTENSTEGAEAIEGATSSSYALGTATEGGTKYYFCVATNTMQGFSKSVTSDIAEIKVTPISEIVDGKLSGSGTEEDPFKISNYEEMKAFRDLVNGGMGFAGMFFEVSADIEMGDDWSVVGVTKDGTQNLQNGRNLNAFRGTLDGKDHKITMAEGSKPIFGYVWGAKISNLKIYGEKINGYGLIDNMEGVGMSGDAVILDNITLCSGSSTLKSGLVGANITVNGFAGVSAAFVTTIKNCTIEENVTVGYLGDQSMIGSFAGRLQGTIENSVSYATVKGTDYVGGIIGTRDNAMGTCHVKGCEFYGTVEATGEHAGGIAGGGYSNSTAPNGVKITVNDCKVEANITGKDKVGGILGGDTYVAQAWNDYEFKNNSFKGELTATDGTFVGGIIGYYLSLNKCEAIEGNTYDCDLETGFGGVKYVDTNSETHEDVYGEMYFNTETSTEGIPSIAGNNWRIGYNRTDDPLGADKDALAKKVKEEPEVLASLSMRAAAGETAAEYPLEPAFDPEQKEYTFYLPDSATYAYAWAALPEGKEGEITLEYKNPASGADIKKTIGESGNVYANNLGASNSLLGQDVIVKIDGEEAYLLHVVRQATLASGTAYGLNIIPEGEEAVLALTPSYNRTVYEYDANVSKDIVLNVKVRATVRTGTTLTVDGKTTEEDTVVVVTPAFENHTYDLKVTVSGEGAKTGEYVIHVNEMPSEIVIAKAPDKLIYEPGEEFDPAGMEVKAVYENGDTVDLTAEDYSCVPQGPLALGDTTIEVSYHGASAGQLISFNTKFQGSGSKEDPFQIATAEDMKTLDEYVEGGETFAGTYLKVLNDITLEEGWSGVGAAGKPFSGDFDGGDHTLTIPSGGKALFTFVRDAQIHDLNVYGEKIEDYGLVSIYTTDSGVASVAVFDNVTLKSGTQTLYSGFIGGYASGTNLITIKNCTIEEGVIVGYDKEQSNIGGFAGEFNGYIENSTSNATVYGVDYVGGVVANKGQTMGTFKVDGCTFGGTVEATGSYVGGIVGAGYGGARWGMASGWSTPGVTIDNCVSTGTVKGDKGVGGILGGEGAQAQAWDNGPTYIRNNAFCGTVSGNAYVGGDIGFMISLNKNSYIENNYYASECGAAAGIGAVGGIDTTGHEAGMIDTVFYFSSSTEDGTTAAEIRDLVPGHELENYIEIPVTSNQKTLASAGYKNQFKTDHHRTDDPLGADKANLCYTDEDLADYTAVNAALEKVPEDLSIYTEESAAALEEAIAAVDRLSKDQEAVDAMAKAIEDAIAALVPKDVPATGIELDQEEAEIAATNTLQLKATLTPAEATDEITWESSDPAIAEVDENGLVTAKKYGKATITASAGDLKAACEVQVLFKDVANHKKSYFDPVYWAVGKGITNVSVEFRPDDPVNRGEFTAFLYRLAGKPKVSKITNKFSDVTKDTKFAKEISWAVEQGVINGYKDGTFRPTDNITRAQVAIMIWRYAGKPTVKVKKSPFPDVELNNSDTSKAIIWGNKMEIMKGSGGKFLPKDTCTRGQTVTFLYRYYDKYGDK